MQIQIAINFILKLIKNLNPGISWHHLARRMLERGGYQLTSQQMFQRYLS